MADCECLPTCPFFNNKMPDNTGLGAIYKNKYCKGDNSKCARFMVRQSLGGSAVPANLYPNQIDQAKSIIASRGAVRV